MIRNPDHVTIAVADADAAIAFFGLLGFELGHVAQIDGGEPAAYMGNPAMKAAHITLVLKGSDPVFEIQLLHFTQPAPDGPVPVPSHTRNRGFNHLAFRVDSLAGTAAHLKANGVRALGCARCVPKTEKRMSDERLCRPSSSASCGFWSRR